MELLEVAQYLQKGSIIDSQAPPTVIMQHAGGRGRPKKNKGKTKDKQGSLVSISLPLRRHGWRAHGGYLKEVGF
jgi:hypothetical protein